MKYGIAKIDLMPILTALLGEDAELVRVQDIDDDGRTALMVVKAHDYMLPGGGDSAAGNLPTYETRITRQTAAFFKED